MLNDKNIDLLPNKYKVSYLRYKEGRPTIAFSSHQPLLIHTLNTIRQGKVLEFGMGYNSSPLMNILCGLQGRHLLSIETSKQWFKIFRDYQKFGHRVVCMDPTEVIKPENKFFKDSYAIVFVDGAPAEIRQPFIKNIKGHADYIIVHDSECVVEGVKNVYNYDFSSFKHVYHFKTEPPMTSLLSDLEEVNKELLEIFTL